MAASQILPRGSTGRRNFPASRASIRLREEWMHRASSCGFSSSWRCCVDGLDGFVRMRFHYSLRGHLAIFSLRCFNCPAFLLSLHPVAYPATWLAKANPLLFSLPHLCLWSFAEVNASFSSIHFLHSARQYHPSFFLIKKCGTSNQRVRLSILSVLTLLSQHECLHFRYFILNLP